ncbi:hypothetical protein [Streptomyces sp. NPDC002328]|uniref:hypothetical protein n=1 Tax=Streptomyces sp. NPDC002328 TaxID=3364642 RepID=UPI0036C3473F
MTTSRPSHPSHRSHRRATVRLARPARFLAGALAAGALLATAACSGSGDDTTAEPDTGGSAVAKRPVAEQPIARQTTPTATGATTATGSPSAKQTGTPSPAASLTESGAQTALITAADLEDDWTEVNNAEDWRDSLLVGQVDVNDFLTGKSDASECQRLIDGLYGEDLLGKPSGASALTGFQQGEARLLYQVAAYEQADLEKSMDWLGSLPDNCDQFTVTGGGSGGDRTVQVVEATIPKQGDDLKALTVTVKGTTNGSPVTLTLDVAAVRVGSDAITVTNGGLAGVNHDSTEAAVQQGTPRLQDVLAGRSPQSTPSGVN